RSKLTSHARAPAAEGFFLGPYLATFGSLTRPTAASTYKLGPGVANISSLKAGDIVEATLVPELNVYVLRDGEAPGAGGVPEKITADARVLSVDPSYRLLTLQYPNGENETFKVPLGVRLNEMAAGDSVVIRPIEAVSLRQQR